MLSDWLVTLAPFSHPIRDLSQLCRALAGCTCFLQDVNVSFQNNYRAYSNWAQLLIALVLVIKTR